MIKIKSRVFLFSWTPLLLSIAVAFSGCGDGLSPSISIDSINGSTQPASLVDVAIEIGGTGFGAAPGEVEFEQGTNVAQVIPAAGAWSDTGIVVVVPSGGLSGAFSVPGDVVVRVLTADGISNDVNLELTSIPIFSVNDVEWATTTALPSARAGHRAVAVPNVSASAYVVVAGGDDGAGNLATVLSNTIAQDGQLGISWSATTPLPLPRAHHGMVVAHPGNSPVSAVARFLYVLGGQENQTDSPGGTSTVFFASVSTSDGSVGAWSETSVLPESIVGPAVTVYNASVYVVGGLRSDGTPSSAIYSAVVNSDGTLDVWETSANPYPVGISFATAFGYSGNLYVLGGDGAGSTDPSAQDLPGVATARLAPLQGGAVGVWVSTSKMVKRRKKQVTWTAFGQVLVAGGVYDGSAGSQELEGSLVLSNGSLNTWTSITAAPNQIGANVYNAAALVSPIQPSGAGPRFLLLGGQAFAATPPGALSGTVYYNTMP